jgi:hypothetical protein
MSTVAKFPLTSFTAALQAITAVLVGPINPSTAGAAPLDLIQGD